MSKKMVYNNNTLLLSKRDWLRIGSLAKWAQQGTAPLSENQERIKSGWASAGTLWSEDYIKFFKQISLLKLTEDDKQYFGEWFLAYVHRHQSMFFNFKMWVKIFNSADDYNLLLDNLTKEKIVKELYYEAKDQMDKNLYNCSLDALLILFQKAPDNKFCSIKIKQDLICYFIKHWYGRQQGAKTAQEILNIIIHLITFPQKLITGETKEILNQIIDQKLKVILLTIFLFVDPVSLQLLSDLILNLKKSSWGGGTTKLITDGVTQFLNEKIISNPEQLLPNVSKLFDNFFETIEEELYDVIMSSLAKYLNELSRGEYAPFHNACKKINRKFSDKIVRYCEEKNYRGLADSLTIMMDHIEIDE